VKIWRGNSVSISTDSETTIAEGTTQRGWGQSAGNVSTSCLCDKSEWIGCLARYDDTRTNVIRNDQKLVANARWRVTETETSIDRVNIRQAGDELAARQPVRLWITWVGNCRRIAITTKDGESDRVTKRSTDHRESDRAGGVLPCSTARRVVKLGSYVVTSRMTPVTVCRWIAIDLHNIRLNLTFVIWSHWNRPTEIELSITVQCRTAGSM